MFNSRANKTNPLISALAPPIQRQGHYFVGVHWGRNIAHVLSQSGAALCDRMRSIMYRQVWEFREDCDVLDRQRKGQIPGPAVDINHRAVCRNTFFDIEYISVRFVSGSRVPDIQGACRDGCRNWHVLHF